MTIAVNINKIAKIYSMNFFILLFFINSLKVLPKIAHKQIDGNQTKAAVIVRKAVATTRFSSVGKKADTTVKAIVQAFGFIN